MKRRRCGHAGKHTDGLIWLCLDHALLANYERGFSHTAFQLLKRGGVVVPEPRAKFVTSLWPSASELELVSQAPAETQCKAFWDAR